jgi:hypothetical protein
MPTTAPTLPQPDDTGRKKPKDRGWRDGGKGAKCDYQQRALSDAEGKKKYSLNSRLRRIVHAVGLDLCLLIFFQQF